MSEKPAERASSNTAGSRKPKTRRRKPDQDEISTRAYSHPPLEEGGGDQLADWLRARIVRSASF